MVEANPIYAPVLPERVPGQVRKVVQIRNIPLSIAEDIQDIADRRGEIPDDVVTQAILHLEFLASLEMGGGRILHRIPGEDLLGGEDILRELDFGFAGPEHQGVRGKLYRFLRRHHVV